MIHGGSAGFLVELNFSGLDVHFFFELGGRIEFRDILCTSGCLYIYIYTVYMLYLYHLVINSLNSYCQTICNSPISFPASIYFNFYLFVHTSPHYFLFVYESVLCLCVCCFSNDIGPGKYTYDPRA